MNGFGEIQCVFFWGFLIVFGAVMYLLAPRASDESGFFSGHDERGRPWCSPRQSCFTASKAACAARSSAM